MHSFQSMTLSHTKVHLTFANAFVNEEDFADDITRSIFSSIVCYLLDRCSPMISQSISRLVHQVHMKVKSGDFRGTWVL